MEDGMIVRFYVMGQGLVRGEDTEYVWRHWDDGCPIPRVGERVWLTRWGGENDGVVKEVEWRICDGADKKDCDLAKHCADCGIDVTVWLKAVDYRPKKKRAKRSPNSVLCVNDRSTGTSPVGAKRVVT